MLYLNDNEQSITEIDTYPKWVKESACKLGVEKWVKMDINDLAIDCLPSLQAGYTEWQRLSHKVMSLKFHGVADSSISGMIGKTQILPQEDLKLVQRINGINGFCHWEINKVLLMNQSVYSDNPLYNRSAATLWGFGTGV